MEASSAGVQEKLTKHKQSMNECAGLKIGARLALECSNSPLTKLGEQLGGGGAALGKTAPCGAVTTWVGRQGGKQCIRQLPTSPLQLHAMYDTAQAGCQARRGKEMGAPLGINIWRHARWRRQRSKPGWHCMPCYCVLPPLPPLNLQAVLSGGRWGCAACGWDRTPWHWLHRGGIEQ